MIGGSILLLMTGIPVAFAFMVVSVIGGFLFWGGEAGIRQFVLSMFSCLSSFTLLAIPMFTLMGEILFHSGIAIKTCDAIGKCMGRLPGKLALVAVVLGTILAALSGSGLATSAILGTLLLPEMKKRGYKKPMILGPILGSAGLAIMIPPSSMSILIGSIGGISIGELLIGGTVPGLIMAFFYAIYIIVRCRLDPSLAPPFDVIATSFSEKVAIVVRYVLPVGIVIFSVMGLILLGIAGPSEAAATGVFASLLLVALYNYRELNWELARKSLMGTLSVTGMIFLIVAGSSAFSQMLGFSGAAASLVRAVVNKGVSPIIVVILMQCVLLFLGCFIHVASIVMITLPIFMPIVKALNINEVWFGLLMLLNMEMAGMTPPFGSYLFVVKAVSPPDRTMADVYNSGLPFLGMNLLVMILMLAFPGIVLWLPSLMR